MKKKFIVFVVLFFMALLTPIFASVKKATLINYLGTKVVVEVDSPLAKTLFAHGYVLMKSSKKLGATVYQSPALFETSLATAMTTADTSMTLVSGATRDGATLSGNYCFTIDSGSTVTEYVCGSASGTSVTGLTRGIGANGVSSYTALKFAHRYGADVKVTDFPQLQQQSRLMNGTDGFPNNLYYVSHPGVGASSTAIMDKYYIDSSVLSGGAPANNSTAGISKISTGAQAAAGTTGDGTYYYALPSSIATSTSQVAQNSIPVTNSDGKLDPSFINQTANYTFTGYETFSATTTIAASSTTANALKLNNVPYSFPSTQGASSTVWQNNGSGNLTNEYLDWQMLGEYIATSSPATTTVAGLPARKDLRVVAEIIGWSGITAPSLIFNQDGGQNYTWSEGTNGGAYIGQSSVDGKKCLELFNNYGTTSPMFIDIYITNTATNAKYVKFSVISAPATGLNIPRVMNGVGLWNNTTDSISSISIKDMSSGLIYTPSVGSRMTVYGKRN